MNPDLIRRIEELEKFQKSLESSSSIPLNIDQSFRARFANVTGLKVSTKGVDTEDLVVGNAANDGVVVVLNDPIGFLEVSINGVAYNLPYY